jgi:hypothetical protein
MINDDIVKKVLINGKYEQYEFTYIYEKAVCIPAIRDNVTGEIVYKAC